MTGPRATTVNMIRTIIGSGFQIVNKIVPSHDIMVLLAYALTLACWVILHAFLSPADFFQNQLFQKNSFRNTIRVLNSLNSDWARHSVGPDLGPNCLQRLSGKETSRQRFKSLLNMHTQLCSGD